MLIPSSYCCTDDQCPAASERSPCYAQLIDIEVEPASQLSLALEQNAHLQRLERCFRNCPGYLSASLHPSEDGQHVLNYTCWRSREDCERAWQAREDAQGPLSAGVWRLGAKSVRFETVLVDAEGC
ncbi:monooxygenase PumA [Pseudomonas aeruginosa]